MTKLNLDSQSHMDTLNEAVLMGLVAIEHEMDGYIQFRYQLRLRDALSDVGTADGVLSSVKTEFYVPATTALMAFRKQFVEFTKFEMPLRLSETSTNEINKSCVEWTATLTSKLDVLKDHLMKCCTQVMINLRAQTIAIKYPPNTLAEAVRNQIGEILIGDLVFITINGLDELKTDLRRLTDERQKELDNAPTPLH